ncbi:hypothetical protein [Bacillus cereus group sp. BfR-BA-01328]|uniref:hypothetical protein n=1 Tax=Bacillus cereus group sp. BfR-BA-01328 TaxID=2920304 RepID=UPI001F57FBE8
MRHTRNGQLKRFNNQYIVYCIGNLPIDFIRKYAYEDMHLDTTYKWDREEKIMLNIDYVFYRKQFL